MRRILSIVLCLLLLLPCFAHAHDWRGDYDSIVELNSNPPTSLAQKADHWNLVDAAGNVLQEHMLDELRSFHEGIAIVRVGSYYGYLRDDGSFLAQPIYESASRFYDGEAIVVLDGAYRFIDTNGDLIDAPLGDLHWREGYDRVVELDSEPPTCLALKDYVWDLVDMHGNVLKEHMLDSLDSFFDGIAVVRVGAQCGYLKKDGSFLVEPTLDDATPFHEGLALAQQDGKRGYLNTDGQWVIPPVYDYANSFSGGYAAVGLRGAMLSEEDVSSSGPEYEQFWGLIDTQGNEIMPLIYDSSLYYDEKTGIAEVWEDDGQHFFQIRDGVATEIRQIGTELTLEEYMPNSGEKVVELEEAADIVWDESHPLPNLDGATALLPIYAALAQASYPAVLRYSEEISSPVLTCTKTNRAYERLIEGSADIIFCAQPSQAQLEAAAQAGVEFELTPFGKEAFVFIVNTLNPLEGLSVEQIRAIYSGEITQWDELGIEGLGAITAYQRPANSGSQTAMEALMGDVPLMDPAGRVEDFMGEMIDAVEYRNTSDALGYTFRFFCTEMVGSEVKLLAIDGIAPTVENIRSDSYPVTSTLYAVSRKGEPNPNVGIFLDWVCGAQGQALVEKSGYVGWSR